MLLLICSGGRGVSMGEDKVLTAIVFLFLGTGSACYGVTELIAAYRASKFDAWAPSAALGAAALMLSGLFLDVVIRM
jgi:hypothetical protein